MTTDAQRLSIAQEKRTAENYKGSRNVMSGAGWMRKADVRSEHFMIENKLKMSVEAKSYSLKALDLRDLLKRARLEGRIGVMQVDLGGQSYVVLSEADFLDLMGLDE